MLDLIYTSTKAGLKPGTSGFASVAWTRGIPTNLIDPLENLSGYKAVFPPNDPRSNQNPVSFSYQFVKFGCISFYVASRIASAGLDYTARSNKIAHHVVFESMDEIQRIPGGPPALFLTGKNFVRKWDKPAEILAVREIESMHFPPPAFDSCLAKNWLKRKGDAGWAGYIASRFLAMRGNDRNPAGPNSNLYLEYDLSVSAEELMSLIAEITALLPSQSVAAFTFNTYFVQQQIGADCFLRAALAASMPIQTMKRLRPHDVIDLMHPDSIPTQFDRDPYVAAARTGTAVVPTETMVLTQMPEYENAGYAHDLPNESPQEWTESSDANGMPHGLDEQNHPVKKMIFLASAAILLIMIAIFALLMLSRENNPTPAPAENPPVHVLQQEFSDPEPQNIPATPSPAAAPPPAETAQAAVPAAAPRKDSAEQQTEVRNIPVPDDESFRLYMEIMLRLRSGFEKELALPGDWQVTGLSLTGNHFSKKVEIAGAQGKKLCVIRLRNGMLFIRKMAEVGDAEINDGLTGVSLYFQEPRTIRVMRLGFTESSLSYFAPEVVVSENYAIEIRDAHPEYHVILNRFYKKVYPYFRLDARVREWNAAAEKFHAQKDGSRQTLEQTMRLKSEITEGLSKLGCEAFTSRNDANEQFIKFARQKKNLEKSAAKMDPDACTECLQTMRVALNRLSGQYNKFYESLNPEEQESEKDMKTAYGALPNLLDVFAKELQEYAEKELSGLEDQRNRLEENLKRNAMKNLQAETDKMKIPELFRKEMDSYSPVPLPADTDSRNRIRDAISKQFTFFEPIPKE